MAWRKNLGVILNFWRVKAKIPTLPSLKNAKFIGPNIVATGSDTGHLFFFDKTTTDLLNVIKTDGNICNVVEPHPIWPTHCIATCGIDSTVKIYCPFESEIESDHPYFVERDTPLSWNQKFEIIEKNSKKAMFQQQETHQLSNCPIN